MNNYDVLNINTDGGSRGNPGNAAIGVYCTNEDGKEIFSISKKIGITTNNVAEYQAVIEALRYIIQNKIVVGKIRFILDSQLIVMQITGKYKVKIEHLQQLKKHIVDLVAEGRNVKILNEIVFIHVLREKNKEADQLVNDALDS